MLATKTLKIRLDVKREDTNLLLVTRKAFNEGCNLVSRFVFSYRNLSRLDVQKEIYTKLRNETGLKSQMAISCIRAVIGAYRSHIGNNSSWPKKPIEFKKGLLDMVWNRDYSLINGIFSVNTLQGRRKFAFFKNYFEDCFSKKYKFGTAKLTYKHGKFFLHIPVSYEVEEAKDDEIRNVVGTDRGINFIVATYDSKGKSRFVSGKKIKNIRSKYKQLRAQLQKKQTASSRRRMKAIGQRENRWMNDVNHCISKALVEENPAGTLFVLEDLSGVRKATERVKRNQRYECVSWSFYDLEQKLKYKAVQAGQKVINVNPSYTSQTCPKCGHIDKDSRRKKIHTFVCTSCGYSSNDDRIAAMNLYRMGIEYLVESQTSTSSLSGAQSIVPDVTSATE